MTAVGIAAVAEEVCTAAGATATSATATTVGLLQIANDHVGLDGQPLNARIVQLIHSTKVINEVGA